jgi:hypothetical protein
MPAQHCQLAGNRNGGNLMAAAGADADEEGALSTDCPVLDPFRHEGQK